MSEETNQNTMTGGAAFPAENTPTQQTRGATPASIPAVETDPANTNLEGGAPSAAASAEKEPVGGTETGDGKNEAGKTDAPEDGKNLQDPYAELALPEGMCFDEEKLDAFKRLAAEAKLDQASAQKLIALGAQNVKEETQKVFAHIERQAAEAKEAWAEQVKEHFGQKYEQEMGLAAKAVERFGGDELRLFFDEMNIGNHPVLVRAFNKIGKELSEDAFVSGKSTAAGEDKTFTEALYGTK